MRSPSTLFHLDPAILRVFRRRLTNLSSRNRSLVLTSLPIGQFLDLHDTDFLLGKPSFSLIAELIGRKGSMALCDVLDARQQRSNEVSRKLRRLARTARFITEERGTEDLYVGWPFVRGKLLDETVVHGALLFFPVRIEQQGKQWKLTRRGDELGFLNPTLALAYGQFNRVKLPDEVLEKTVDDFDRDPLVFRTQLHEWLSNSPLEINFNSDLFLDRLQFFDKQTAKTLDQLERTGELKLFSEAVLGIFPQAGSYLVPDYDTLLTTTSLLPDTEPPPFDNVVPALTATVLPERFLHTPLPLDASQEAAIRAVKAGQSLVVQGPPGTGKSQLIANLMADAAANGKRVLLVCQKRAALDVVQERLRQVGMASFLALIHDFQDDRRALYAQIASQIEQIDTYRQENNSLNAVLLERDFDLESRRIDDSVADLQAFKEALFSTDTCGVSVKELYLTSQPDRTTINLDDCYVAFRLDAVESFNQRLRDYAAYQQRLGSGHPWTSRVSFAGFTLTDRTRISSLIDQWVGLAKETAHQTQLLTGRSLALPELAIWQACDQPLATLLTLANQPTTAALWPLVRLLRNAPAHAALTPDETQLTHWADEWTSALANPGPEISLATNELPAFQVLLTEARNAQTSWFGWQWWQLTNSGKAQLRQVATANGLTLSETDLRTLANRVDKRIRIDDIHQHILPLLNGLSLPATPDSLLALQQTRQFLDLTKQIPPLGQLPKSCWQTPSAFIDAVTTLRQAARSVTTLLTAAQTYLTDAQLTELFTDTSYVPTLQETLRRDFDLLIESDQLQAGFSEVEQRVIDRLSDVNPDQWPTLFDNSLRLAWINHLEQTYPLLRSVSSLKMGQFEQTLQESLQRKQQLSRDILLTKLREQTYQKLTVNRLNNVVTYRDLLHQVSKKRNIWPVRKLMESFADEVFKVVPCWLASPESVSAIFPLRSDLFDLVIFDEASQCFAESGIPALFRGSQVVVTGDSQQLRPNDLYRVQTDAGESETDVVPTALEVESLLELATHYLPQVSLNHHYRSRSLDLIAFSNDHFYQRKLQLLPYFDDINQHEPAIHYLNVKGTWHQNTNPVEAEAIIGLLAQLNDELPGRSVGIVTFNYLQQQLIQELIETTPDQAWPPNLFVKNIENVQGDERDIIIFSVGYAPDERGRLSMQFGSLNVTGGENRLNVAVTRARERIYVVTSLWPEQLHTENLLNRGPALLKAYLTYALEVSRNDFRPQTELKRPPGSTTLLAHQLARHHANWLPELPFADLTVKAGDQYAGLVLTDDGTYYQQTAKEAHAYLPVALRLRNWPFERTWSRTYWQTNDDQ